MLIIGIDPGISGAICFLKNGYSYLLKYLLNLARCFFKKKILHSTWGTGGALLVDLNLGTGTGYCKLPVGTWKYILSISTSKYLKVVVH